MTAIGPVPLNVDTTPELLTDGKIRPRVQSSDFRLQTSDFGILESGKSMIAAQSADPIGDRQVTVEVKATILR